MCTAILVRILCHLYVFIICNCSYFKKSSSSGLTHLHKNGIIHRDLKSMNVLLCDGAKVVKITDLGVSRQLSENTFLLKTLYGTPLYLSPEMVQGTPYNEKTDIWSLGVILYEMCALITPFQGSSLLALACAIKDGVVTPIPNCYSKLMHNFIRWLLIPDFNIRPSVADISKQRLKLKADLIVPGSCTLKNQSGEEDSIADTDSGSEDSLENGGRNKTAVMEGLSTPIVLKIPEAGGLQPNSSTSRTAFATELIAPFKQISVKENFFQNGNNNVAKAADQNQKDPPATLHRTNVTAPVVVAVSAAMPISGDNNNEQDSSMMVAINSDRIASYMRRYGLVLRKLMDARVFNSKETEEGEETIENEILKVNSIIRALDSAARTGMISIKVSKLLGMSNKTVIPPPQQKIHPKVKSHHEEEEQESEFQYRPGRGLQEDGGKKMSGEPTEVVQVLNYSQPSRLTTEPFKGNAVIHKIFANDNVVSGSVASQDIVDLVSSVRVPPYCVNKEKCTKLK